MGKSRETEITAFIHAVRMLVRRARRAGAAQGLSWTEAAVLARLSKDGPSTTAELARAESMKPQSMGAKIVVLEQLKLVERKPHPEDGRQIIIVLTNKGKDVCKLVQDAQHDWFAETFDKLQPNERSTLIAATKIIERMGDLSL